jgi:hypothetical protein
MTLRLIADHDGYRRFCGSPRTAGYGRVRWAESPRKLKDIWALRVRPQMEDRLPELALLNLGFDRKPRGCDLITLRVRDVSHGDSAASRAVVVQHGTRHRVQFDKLT